MGTKTKKPTATTAAPEGGEEKEKREVERIDLTEFIDAATATLPEGCELEVSGVSKGGKRLDLIRGDAIVRLISGIRTVDVKHLLIGIAKGRAIE